MTTVFHVSDLHFGWPAVPEQIDAIEQIIHESRFDVVVISGDLTQRARSGEFQRAAAFIRDARKVSRVIAVPGNHDVKWWRAPLGFGRGEHQASHKVWGTVVFLVVMFVVFTALLPNTFPTYNNLIAVVRDTRTGSQFSTETGFRCARPGGS